MKAPVSILQDWQAKFSARSTLKSHRILRQALDDFERFRDTYLGYFRPLLDASDLTRTARMRLEDQVTVALNLYWEPLARVAEQHSTPSYRDCLDNQTVLDQYIATLTSTLGRGKFVLPGVLVYFDKVTTIRRFPYTDIAFIGIPYSTFEDQEGREMAIAHELGHHLYWNMDEFQALDDRKKEYKQSLQAALAGQPEIVVNMVLDWTEEIFADVVGTLLAKEKYVESSRNLAVKKAGNRGSLANNDLQHPPYGIRPAIAAETLIAGSFNMDVFLQEYGLNKESFCLLRSYSPQEVNLDRIREILSQGTPLEDQVPCTQVLPVLVQAARWIKADIENFSNSEHPSKLYLRTQATDSEKSFDQLLAVASRRQAEYLGAKAQPGPNVHEILLKPKVLEGHAEDEHAHGMVAVHGYHYFWHKHE